MSDQRKYGSLPGSPCSLSCSEFDALLADAIDGTLGTEQMHVFDHHARTCDGCGPLLAGAREGLAALESLEEVEPPNNLIHNILARTSNTEASVEATKSALVPERHRSSFSKFFAAAMRPRMATTFAMAFFSLSLMFSVMGFHVSDLRHMDLRPSAIHRTAAREYYSTSARVVRYYKNTRLVYELEARLREFRNATRDSNPDGKSKPNSNTSRQNNEKQQTGREDIARNAVKPSTEPSSAELRSAFFDLANDNVFFPRRFV